MLDCLSYEPKATVLKSRFCVKTLRFVIIPEIITIRAINNVTLICKPLVVY